VNEKLRAICDLCLSIDRRAEVIYHKLSACAEENELSEFWAHMAAEESEHSKFWIQLSAAIERGQIPMIFDDPREVYFDLLRIDKEAAALELQAATMSSISGSFRAAYRLEFFLLHPAFETLFHVSEAFVNLPSPEKDYQEHIRGFIETFNRFTGDDLSMELAGEMLITLWKQTRKSAVRLLKLYHICSRLPACAACGNIRDEEGKWLTASNYMEQNFHSVISHGICPACTDRLYPDIATKIKNKGNPQG